jgi:predicted transcriptional regulator
MDDSVEITVRLPAELQDRAAAIAHSVSRPTAWVIERAVEAFVATEGIEQALIEADAGNFATDAEVRAVFAKWQQRCPGAG